LVPAKLEVELRSDLLNLHIVCLNSCLRDLADFVVAHLDGGVIDGREGQDALQLHDVSFLQIVLVKKLYSHDGDLGAAYHRGGS